MSFVLNTSYKGLLLSGSLSMLIEEGGEEEEEEGERKEPVRDGGGVGKAEAREGLLFGQ